MAESRETEALVLNSTELGESDLIITLFCPDSGRLSAMAKGAKRSLKRFVNKLEIFSFLHITYRLKSSSSLAFLAEAELHTAFLHIRRNLELYSIASVIREFLLIGVKENEPAEDIFRLSLWALHNLDRIQPPMTVLALFLIRFYDYMGYRPDLQSCARCGSVVDRKQRYAFDSSSGRIVCSLCSSHLHNRIALSHGTIKILGTAQDLPIDRLHRLKMSGTILFESISLLKSYGNELFQRDMISWKSTGNFLTGHRGR